MAKEPTVEAAPTMIIPRGTEVEVDAHGQLSVRAPGNLVIQNSGSYGNLESQSGSIRIDHGVEVEAVGVKGAGDCFVQGSLTAWKVTARALQLEEGARANVVLQETDQLDIGRDARLVGNFDSEKELFLLFSRFAKEFRSLPFFFEKKEGGTEPGMEALPPAGEPAAHPKPADLPESLFFALVLLERDGERGDYGHTTQRVLEELVNLLREDDLETLELTYRTLFGKMVDPREDTRRAHELIDGYFTRGEGMRPPSDEP